MNLPTSLRDRILIGLSALTLLVVVAVILTQGEKAKAHNPRTRSMPPTPSGQSESGLHSRALRPWMSPIFISTPNRPSTIRCKMIHACENDSGP